MLVADVDAFAKAMEIGASAIATGGVVARGRNSLTALHDTQNLQCKKHR